MPLTRRTLPTRAILLTALAGTPLALADTWDNSAGTAQWSSATNWADNTEPTINDAAIFPSPIPLNQATIVMTSTEFASSLTFNHDYTLQGGFVSLGTGTINVAGSRTATISTTITGSNGLVKTGSGTLRLLPISSNSFSGLIDITGFSSTLYVRSNGALGNSANDITISGGRLQLDGITNSLFLVTGRTITAGALGATIELQNNAFLDLNAPLGTGSNPITFTGSGTVELNSTSTRTGSTFVSVPLLRLNNASGLGTPGSVSLSSGAVLEINNGSGIFTGFVSPSSGTTIRGGTGTHTFDGFANVSGPVTLNGGLTSNDTLILGSNGASVWNNGSGTTSVNVGTVQLNSANNYVGDWTINATLQVNHPGALGSGTTPILVGGSGRLKLNTPILVRDITLNNPGGGIELLQDVTVTGHIPIAPNAGFIPIIGPDHQFTLSGANASITYTGTAFFGGAIGVGSMRVIGGADVSGSATRLSAGSGGPGTLAVSGAGSTWVNTGEFWVGDSGSGALTVDSGGMLSCQSVYVGVGDNSTATVTGEGSSMTSTQLLHVGLGCTSSLSVLAGADVVTGSMKIGELTGASGTATVHGTGSTLIDSGLLEVGITGTGNLVLFNGGSASCLGLSLGNGAASSGSCTVSGGLSRLDCGSAGVLMSQNGASSTLNLSGGIVDINGDITDAGAGVSTFVLDAATLDMHNFAIGAGPSPIDNLQFRSGTLKNVSQINNGAGLTKTGPGTLYLNTPNAYTGPTTVTQGTLFVVNSSGSATGTGLVSVAAGATLAGPGIIGGLVANDGIVAPEGFIGNPIGTLTVQGTYSQFSTGALRIDIESATSNDRLVVTGGGASVAAGTLDVQLLNGFMPAPGDSFTILTAAFISGSFPTTNLPVLSTGLIWQVQYATDHVQLTVASSCPTDLDDGSGTGTPDGGVGIEDLLYYVGQYDVGAGRADVDDGSGTGTPDGGVGIEDLLYYLTRYSAGC